MTTFDVANGVRPSRFSSSLQTRISLLHDTSSKLRMTLNLRVMVALLVAVVLLLCSPVQAAVPFSSGGQAGSTGVGGPFEAVAPIKSGDPKFKQIFASWKALDRAERGDIAIPSAMPVGGTRYTSGFGVRSDPFRGRAAMHTGIDLAGPMGTRIYATADGVVNRAEWVSGYGNLVEINHGPTIQTRYGHLSRSLVRSGQRVKRGDLIALMGSTGRSTGSHLHYEVRIAGKAVNPTPFMQSNDYLLAFQRRIDASHRALAMGGPVVPSK